MRIQGFIFSLALFTFFDFIQAAENSASVEPFFSDLLDSFLFKNINEAAFKSDFRQAMKLFRKFPLQTLKVVNSLGSRDFIFFFAALISSDDFNRHLTRSPPGDILRGDEYIKSTLEALHKVIKNIIECSLDPQRAEFIDFTFSEPHKVIGENIECSLKGSDLIYRKEVILEILSMLKRASCSSSVEMFITFDWNCFFLVKMSPKVFIHSYSHFIENLEDDSVIGFEKAYYKLKRLSIQYGGVIPSQEDSKSRIISLFLLCAYYAKDIESKIFAPFELETTDSYESETNDYADSYESETNDYAPLESETTDSTLLDPKTTDPGALSFFLGLIHFNSLEKLFSSCGSVDEEVAREFFDREDFRDLLYKYEFENHPHQHLLLSEILEHLDVKDHWDFKVYVKLVYGISI